MTVVVQSPAALTSANLREILVNQASEAALTCTFVPGGKFGGVGIRSHLYCANCSQGRIWHEVAAGLRLIETAEAIVQAGAELEQMRRRLSAQLAEHEAATRILGNCRAIRSSSGASQGGSAV